MLTLASTPAVVEAVGPVLEEVAADGLDVGEAEALAVHLYQVFHERLVEHGQKDTDHPKWSQSAARPGARP